MKLRNTPANETNQDAARETAILQNLNLVKDIAKRFHGRVPPCITLDDLVSAGMVGLIQAVDRFDRARGLKFRSYAQHRIHGAMLDFLREEDPLSRTERRRVRESTHLSPTTVSLDEIQLHRLAAPAPAAFTTRLDVREARRSLSSRENRVIALLYDFGWQSREVAADLRVNESRVSQIKQRAISKLRLHLEPVVHRGPHNAALPDRLQPSQGLDMQGAD
jgi:RNA polymerase sigma factor for flagellar operon FliA